MTTKEEILKDVCGFDQRVKITELDNDISTDEALKAMRIYAEQYFVEELDRRFPKKESYFMEPLDTIKAINWVKSELLKPKGGEK